MHQESPICISNLEPVVVFFFLRLVVVVVDHRAAARSCRAEVPNYSCPDSYGTHQVKSLDKMKLAAALHHHVPCH